MERPNKELLDKYLTNQLTPKEAEVVLDWLATPEGQLFLSQSIDDDFDALDDNQKILLKPSISAEEVLFLAKASNPPLSQQSVKRKSKIPYMNIAASIAFAMITAFFTYQFLFPTEKFVSYSTEFGEKLNIVLPDSSVITLNGNSSVKFEKSWKNKTERQVWFEGEGFFKVKKTTNKLPFTVFTDFNFNVKVLGTTFNVTARPQTSRVVLETGSIALDVHSAANDTSHLFLEPGEMAEFDPVNSLVIKKEVETRRYTSWKEHILIFEGTSLQEITRMLTDNYGFTVVVSTPEILNQKFTGSVPSDDIDALLKGLETLLDIQIVKEGKLIKLMPNP